MVGAGWKPGWSTDYDAVFLADKFKINTVVNLSNISFVYDRNPQEHKNAKPLEKLSWNNYLKISKSKWIPGMNLPFDPIASKLAKKRKIRVGILNGGNLVNVEKFLDGKNFKGTLIG